MFRLVFTHDMDKAFFAFERLEVGGVVVGNGPRIRIDSQPYGGVKDSGFGRKEIRREMRDIIEEKVLIMVNVGEEAKLKACTTNLCCTILLYVKQAILKTVAFLIVIEQLNSFSQLLEMEDDVHAPTESALPTEIPDLVALLEFQERIVQVCQKLKTLIDPTDDLYVVQKSLANEGIVPIFVELLSSVKNAEQLIELCETVGILCANIESVATRKRSGLESGFQERSFNPVQNELAEYNGFR